MIALFVAFNDFTRRREALLAYCAAPGMSYDGHGGDMEMRKNDKVNKEARTEAGKGRGKRRGRGMRPWFRAMNGRGLSRMDDRGPGVGAAGWEED